MADTVQSETGLPWHPGFGPPVWREHAERGEWLEAAKAAVLDQGAASGTALTCATIALTEALNREASDG